MFPPQVDIALPTRARKRDNIHITLKVGTPT